MSDKPSGMNEKLGLPRDLDGKMQKVAICFDVDGTLIDHLGNDRVRVNALFMACHKLFKNTKIVVWSGGGLDYAARRGRELGIEHMVWRFLSKHQYAELRNEGYYILAIDDIQDTRLGDINLIVRQ